MEIHKPKPWHGAREFLKEYLIIVVGVLTALAAEAGVEWLHWRHLAEQHDADLRAGAYTIAANALQRMAIDGCVTDELRQTAEALRRPGSAWTGLKPDATGRVADYLPPRLFPLSRAWPYAQWESALADGSLTHLSGGRLETYLRLYRTSRAIGEQQEKVFELMPELTPLAFDQSLTAQDKARYLGILARIDHTETLMISMSRVILTVAANDGLWPPQDVREPPLEASRARLGECVRAPDRTAFLPGGALVQSSVLPKR